MEETSHDFSAMSYLKIFFRRKELIIIPTIIGLVIGVCTGMVLPKTYLSSTVILVEEGKSDNPLFHQIAVSTTMRQRLATIRESMLGWNSLKKLVRRLKLDTDIRTTKQYENLILGIRSRISIKAKGNSIIQLAFTDENPEQTQAVVENITDIFIERNKIAQTQETADAIIFIEEQLKVYKGKIKSAEIAKLQDSLNELLIDSTEKHPLVKQLRERIEIKKEELAEANLTYTEPDRIKVETTNPIIETIKSALESIEGTGDASAAAQNPNADMRLVLMDNFENVLARDARVNENIYNVLLQRLETAKITQRLQSSKEGTRYTIIDPPRIPIEPIKPNRPLVAAVGLFIGALLGFALVAGGEFLDKSFIDVEEAKDFLGVPLLGAISKIETADSIRAVQNKMVWMYSLTIILGIAAIAITSAVAGMIN
jgi:uncharacterized protein involved in exopolysaccharide biosynthesis